MRRTRCLLLLLLRIIKCILYSSHSLARPHEDFGWWSSFPVPDDILLPSSSCPTTPTSQIRPHASHTDIGSPAVLSEFHLCHLMFSKTSPQPPGRSYEAQRCRIRSTRNKPCPPLLVSKNTSSVQIRPKRSRLP